MWIQKKNSLQKNHEIPKDNLMFGIAQLFTFKVVAN